MRKVLVSSALLWLMSGLTFADTIPLPADDPAVKLEIPASWYPWKNKRMFIARSPDERIHAFFEVVSAGADAYVMAIASDFLRDRYDMEMTPGGKTTERDFEMRGRRWSRISMDGISSVRGPSVIHIMLTEVGQGKVLLVTYWFSKEASEESVNTLIDILGSVKPVD